MLICSDEVPEATHIAHSGNFKFREPYNPKRERCEGLPVLGRGDVVELELAQGELRCPVASLRALE